MKKYLLSYLVAVSLIVFTTSCEKKSEKRESKSTSGSMESTTSGPSVEEETILVEELPNETDRYFDEALQSFTKGDYKATSASIDKGIASINKEIQVLGEKPSADLQASLSNLKMLSKDVRMGKVKSEDVLKNSFAQADAKLANDYLVITEVYVTEQPNKLEKGLGHISSALKRGSRVVETETKDAYENVSEKAEALMVRIKKDTQKGKKTDMSAIKRDLQKIKQELNDVEAKLDKSSASAKNMKKS